MQDMIFVFFQIQLLVPMETLKLWILEEVDVLQVKNVMLDMEIVIVAVIAKVG